MHFPFSHFVRRTETNIQKTIRMNQSAVKCTNQIEVLSSLFQFHLKSIRKERRNTAAGQNMKNMEWPEGLKDVCPASDYIQVSTNPGYYWKGCAYICCRTEHVPFHTGSSAGEWRNKKPSKKEYKVRLNIREKRRKNKNAKQGSQDWQYEFCAWWRTQWYFQWKY